MGFVVNFMTKPDCPVLTVLISLQVLLNFRIAYPLGDIKGLSTRLAVPLVGISVHPNLILNFFHA
jgi:hypothetical protein